MNKSMLFERNLLALSRINPELCTRLSRAETTKGKYRMLESRSGLVVPAYMTESGQYRPLHSMMDPEKEAKRLAGTLNFSGFLIFLGLGAAYIIREALRNPEASHITIIDYDIDAFAELCMSIDYIDILNDSRVSILIDPHRKELQDHVLYGYRPELHGGITVHPLRSRTDTLHTSFSEASECIKETIQTVSDDYSVQAYFGKQWYINTLRNLHRSQAAQSRILPQRHISICAAGPSLDLQYERLKKKRKSTFLLSTDTALPALVQNDIIPDALVSIDCQHISYFHFMNGLPGSIPLFLDLSSPPILSELAENSYFFSGGHPLTMYISQHWKPFPIIDTSGGNVTYAAVSLADALGARQIDLYGADFSYPFGQSYAKASYVHPHFQGMQNRFQPLESCFASFIYRNSGLKKIVKQNSWRYETKPLEGYRKHLEKLSGKVSASLHTVEGNGAPIQLYQRAQSSTCTFRKPFYSGTAVSDATQFLLSYRKKIENLSCFKKESLALLSDIQGEERDILTTLLPTAAALRRRRPGISSTELLRTVRSYCLKELDAVLKNHT